jgi:hypothetical protein
VSQIRRSGVRTQREYERIRWQVRRRRRAAGCCWSIRVPGGSTPSPALELNLMFSPPWWKRPDRQREFCSFAGLGESTGGHHADGFWLPWTQPRSPVAGGTITICWTPPRL